MEMPECWLPKPKMARAADEPFALSAGGVRIIGSAENAWALQRIADGLKEAFRADVRIEHRGLTGWNVAVTREADGEPLARAAAPLQHAEAYELRVESGSVTIDAGSRRGCLYGWFTLRQWIDFHRLPDRIPGLFVQDVPDLEYRGFHIDLKGGVPHAGYLKEAIERLASFKINTLLIEYENQFPFRSLPGIHKPGGLSPESLREILHHAKLYGMKTIPVVQCLGHADYVLMHEEYAGLRERDFISQYCPSEPGTLALFQAMVDEILAYHPDSEYVHIGADEAWALGKCGKCAQKAQSGTKVDVYLDYVREAASYILSKGKRPVIWDDMFHSEKCMERIGELPEGTVISSWSYYDSGMNSNWVWWAGKYYASKRWLERDPGAIPQMNWLEELPEAELEQIRRVWDEGQYPEFGLSAVPWVRDFLDRGYEVWGTACVRGADFTNAWSAYPEDRVQNAMFWARFAHKMGMRGVIASAWTRFYSSSPPIEPWETGWYPTLAHAAFAWNKETGRDEFDRRWTNVFAEVNFALLQAIRWIDRGMKTRKNNYYLAAVQLLDASRPDDPALRRYADMLRLSAEWESIALGLEEGLGQVEWMYYYKERRLWRHDHVANRSVEAVKGGMSRAEEWERKAIQFAGSMMPLEEARELVETKVHPFKVRFDAMFQRLPDFA